MAEGVLTVPFEARGYIGSVSVSITTNDDPDAVGCPPWARGFPICEAAVDFGARGYAALLGWVQLVRMRSPYLDPDDRWVTDPLEVYRDVETPFGFYGIAPTLFDAPARRDRSQYLDWHAESYLCFAPTSPMAREAKPVAAFSWGFLLDRGQIVPRDAQSLLLSAWSEHLELLEASYPTWAFMTATPP